MTELKSRIHDKSNGLDYVLVGDYYVPDLKLPEEHRPIGMWGRLHRTYLEQYRPTRFSALCLSGELHTYLADLDEQATERCSLIIEQMKQAEGVTETMKADKPLFITIRKHLVKRAVKHFFYGNTFHSCHFRIAVAKNEIHTTTVRHGINAIVADIYNVAAAYDNSLADTQKILLRQSR